MESNNNIELTTVQLYSNGDFSLHCDQWEFRERNVQVAYGNKDPFLLNRNFLLT